jgi:acetyl-CoA C-acetyltransferase
VVAPSAIAQPGASRSRGAPFSSNAPAQLGAMLGAKPRWAALSAMGGNSSQYMINTLAERIARGETELGMAVGCEVLGSVSKRMAKGVGFDDWIAAEDLSLDEPPVLGDTRPGVSPYEARHGLDRPINIYPIFENALRARDGRSLADHARGSAPCSNGFTEVAAENPHAWFPTRRSAQELTSVSDRNRMIGFPYPKLLNAIMEVDQSAGVLIASVKKAAELGVPEDRWVYLHGCADAHDIWHVLGAPDFHSSPAMRLTGQRAFEMAGIGAGDLNYIDLYSCFPSAVQVGAEELGIRWTTRGASR